MQAKGTDERELAAAIRKGDEAAFEALYSRYAPALRNYSETIVKDSNSAYEVVQDTFVSVWMNRRRIDPDRPLRNYLLRAVHNNSLRLVRKENARRAREQFLASESMESQTSDQKEVQDYDIDGLVPAVERLPEQSRKIFRMTYMERMKSTDIATELSISIRTVESILYKARKRLREELKKI